MGKYAAMVFLLASCGGGDDAASPDAEIPAYCGNGILEGDEVCDDGNNVGGDECGPLCQRAECGNGFVDVDAGESCDDANQIDGDGCSTLCVSEGCGNGELDVFEVCDDGDHDDGDGCSANCASDETCGNGVVDVAVGEECEDGGTVADDGCSPTCTFECGLTNGGFTIVPGWYVQSGSIDIAATGHDGPGAALLPACTSFVYQQVCVRPFAQAGTLEVSHWVRASAGASDRAATIEVDGVDHVRQASTTTTYTERAVCLGEGVYDGLFDLEVRYPSVGGLCGSEVVSLDDFTLRTPAAGRCADPGTVLHGDFEDPVGWSSPGGGTIIDDGTGNHVLHLHANAGVCTSPQMTGRISPPLSTTLPQAALQLTVRSSAPGPLRLRFMVGAFQSQTFTPPGGSVPTTLSMCIGAQARGQAFDLELRAMATTGTCANEIARDFLIDDLQFVTDPSCP